MSQEATVLHANTRERLGTRYAKRLRAAGRTPAIIFGHKTAPVSISVESKPMLAALHHGAHVISVQVDGGVVETCLVKDLQFGYLGDNVIHVDFARVDLNEMVTVSVTMHFIGQAENAKKPGAVVTHEAATLQVRCKVKDIPESIRIDLSHMDGDVLQAKQVKLPADVTLVSDPHAAVVRIVVVVEEAEGEATTAAAATEPEVLTARKEVPEGEAGAKPGAAAKPGAESGDKKK